MDSKLSSEERRRAIICSSLPLFVQKGMSVTTKELASAASVSEALLYKHFSTKEELFQSLKDFCCEAIDRDASELVQNPPSLELLVEGFFFTNIAVFYDHPEEPFTSQEVTALVLRSLLDTGEFATEIHSHFGKYIPYMEDSLSAAIEKGQASNILGKKSDVFWLYHNLVTGTKMTMQPQKATIPYAQEKKKIIREICISGLRMCGVKEESISKLALPLIKKLEIKYFKLLGEKSK